MNARIAEYRGTDARPCNFRETNFRKGKQMKLEIWKEPEEPVTPKEEPTIVRLLPDGDEVVLHAVDEDGHQVRGGQILKLTEARTLSKFLCGEIVLASMINKGLSLQTDEKGYVKVVKG